MVKQADGWESGLGEVVHRRAYRWCLAEAERLYRVDCSFRAERTELEAEYHEACAEGRTTAAEESDDE